MKLAFLIEQKKPKLTMKRVKHIGIILDGNRRFAKRLMKQPWKGHEWGAQKVELLFSWCKELGIPEITLYAFSLQNFNRPKREFDYLMTIFRKFLDKLKQDPRLKQDNIKVNFIGRIHLFAPDITRRMEAIMALTKSHRRHTFNFALAYGGREEIVDAVQEIGRMIEQGTVASSNISEKLIENHLYMKSNPDLSIRTGGETRTSNFLIWQSNYSEWIFLDKCWPEFEKEDLVQALQEFSRRERRFGK